MHGVNCSTVSTDGCKSVGGPWTFDTLSYVTEGVASLSVNVANKNIILKKQWKSTVDYLLKTQNMDGYWGRLNSVDLMRSPRCLTLLSWWLEAVDTPKYKDKRGTFTVPFNLKQFKETTNFYADFVQDNLSTSK